MTLLGVLLLLAVGGGFPAQAKIGVGVDVGQIEIEEPLAPGEIYQLPPIHVINTGDQPAVYGVSVSHQEGQQELRPDSDWFSFNDQSFPLEPDTAQRVETTLRVPITAPPGVYYALVSGHPEIKTEGTGLGIAAATKLRFRVESGSAWLGIYHRVRSLMTGYSPWPQLTIIALAVGGIVLVIRRRFDLRLQVSRRPKE